LDGINDFGLAESIVYGGPLVQGDGFGITIVIRYLLETCSTVEEAIQVFQRIPVHLDCLREARESIKMRMLSAVLSNMRVQVKP
jgi:penicillin V acylase-like amidase (Ntn superfamily)